MGEGPPSPAGIFREGILSIRFAILASGSKGNAALIQSGGTSILVDAGLSTRELDRRLGIFKMTMADIDALVVTHLHGDHIRNSIIGACVRYRVPLYHSRHAAALIAKKFPTYKTLSRAKLHSLYDGAPFQIGSIAIEAVSVPHDADGGTHAIVADCASGEHRRRIVLATDFGDMRPPLVKKFANADALVMEFNHDEEMLWNSKRTEYLKRRVVSVSGHMSNAQAAQALADIVAASDRRPSIVVQAHISGECNTRALAYEAAQSVVTRHDLSGMEILSAYQDEPCGWFQLA